MEFKQIIAMPQTQTEQIKPKRKSHTPKSEKMRLIKLWQNSQMTQTSFCRQHNLNIKTFASWLKKSNPSSGESTEKIKEHAIPSRLHRDIHFNLHLPNEVILNITIPLEAPEILTFIQGIITCKSN